MTSQDGAGGPAAALLDELVARGLWLATAESLTGGGVGAALTDVPGASRAYAGGVVSYATRVKVDLLGVPEELVRREGVVSAACAEAMATGVRGLLATDVGLATTGVAGPDPQEGRPAGVVHVAVADRRGAVSRRLDLAGRTREEVRAETVRAALALTAERVAGIPRREVWEGG
jgi:nicotinamide-nucleotide amidase